VSAGFGHDIPDLNSYRTNGSNSAGYSAGFAPLPGDTNDSSSSGANTTAGFDDLPPELVDPGTTAPPWMANGDPDAGLVVRPAPSSAVPSAVGGAAAGLLVAVVADTKSVWGAMLAAGIGSGLAVYMHEKRANK
jgi:hypothetical protein